MSAIPTYEEARTIILDSVAPLGAERVPLQEAGGRVIAEELTAPWDLPSSDNSAMDGFAVRADGVEPGTRLEVIGYIAAGGAVSGKVKPGTAVKIMTGARIPPGTEAVVPVEEAEESDGFVTVNAPVKRGQHIRFRAEDVGAGEAIIPAGTLLRPPEIGMLATFCRANVAVHRKVRVAVLSTGDELVELGTIPGEAGIVNSNSYSLAAALREIGAEPVLLGIARDNRESLREKMVEGLTADALITTAGVSAGDLDFVRDVLAELGVVQKFWKVQVKPGGPMAFAVRGTTPVFSLPGNPVATMITFDEFVRPALLRMMGHRAVLRRDVTAVLQEEVRKKPGKVQFLRVRLARKGKRWIASTSGDQNTGILRTMLQANGIAILPQEKSSFAAGDEVTVHLIGSELEAPSDR
jgi:molybdopterin molybdotransferase